MLPFNASRWGNVSVLPNASGGGGGRSCSDGTASAAFLARTSGLTNAQKDAYCVLLNGLDTDGLTSLLDVLYIFAAPTSTIALLNLVQNAYNGTIHGTVTFTANTGMQGDGSTGFITNGFVAGEWGSGTVVGSDANGHLGAYVLSNNSPPGNSWWLGTHGGSTDYGILGSPSSGHIGAYMQNNVSLGASVTSTQSSTQGMWIASQTNTSNLDFYKNGSSLIAGTSNNWLIQPANETYYLAYNNNSGGGSGASSFTVDQVAALTQGHGLTSTQANNLAARINTYMTTLGINVY